MPVSTFLKRGLLVAAACTLVGCVEPQNKGAARYHNARHNVVGSNIPQPDNASSVANAYAPEYHGPPASGQLNASNNAGQPAQR